MYEMNQASTILILFPNANSFIDVPLLFEFSLLSHKSVKPNRFYAPRPDPVQNWLSAQIHCTSAQRFLSRGCHSPPGAVRYSPRNP